MSKKAKVTTATTMPNDRAQAAFVLGAVKEALWRLEAAMGIMREEEPECARYRIASEEASEAFNTAIDVINDLEANGWEIGAHEANDDEDSEGEDACVRAYRAMLESHRKRGEAKIMDAFDRQAGKKDGGDQQTATLN
ncbi:MAG: hypothetical protein ACYC9J_00395 [Sulfuricaulis sp.]